MGKVSYCATCDGAFYRDKHVLAVGGGNTAVEDAIYLASRFTAKTTLVEELYAKADEHNIEVKLPYVLVEIVPTDDGAEIDHVAMRNVQTDRLEELKVDGVFVFIGMIPNTDFAKGFVQINELGYIQCDSTYLRSSVPGVFVAGDCRVDAPMQLATACGDGVAAAMMLKEYFRDPAWWDTAGREPSEQAAGW